MPRPNHPSESENDEKKKGKDGEEKEKFSQKLRHHEKERVRRKKSVFLQSVRGGV